MVRSWVPQTWWPDSVGERQEACAQQVEERIHGPVQCREVVVTEHESPPLGCLRNDAGGLVPDERGEILVEFVQVEQGEGKAELLNLLIPCRLPAEGGVGDVAQRAGFAAEIVVDQVAELPSQPSIGAVHAHKSQYVHAPTVRVGRKIRE